MTHYFKSIFANYELIKEFKPVFKTYGFHNPVVRLYKLEPKQVRAKKVSVLKTEVLPGEKINWQCVPGKFF